MTLTISKMGLNYNSGNNAQQRNNRQNNQKSSINNSSIWESSSSNNYAMANNNIKNISYTLPGVSLISKPKQTINNNNQNNSLKETSKINPFLALTVQNSNSQIKQKPFGSQTAITKTI